MEIFEKYLQREKREENLEKFWDKRSEWFYQRTEKSKEKFSERMVFQLIKQRELLNQNSKVLDIGCGTGRHLLEFSQYTPSITGTDISSHMLAYAKEKLSHISQARWFHGEWMEIFTKEKEYDFVFASMTPAISSIENIKRMCEISRKHCVMERFVYHRDDIRIEIENLLGRKLNRSHQNAKEYTYAVWNIVWNLGYFPEIFYDRHIYETEQTIEEYLEQILCSEEEGLRVVELLRKKEKDGKIATKEYLIKAVILWDVSEF